VNTPAFLAAAAAVFWGWQTGQWFIGAIAAVLLEAPRWVDRRWDLSTADLRRVADFCTVVVLAIAAYLYFAFGNPRAVTLLFQWLPVLLAPLAMAQGWSTSRDVDLSVLFWVLRRTPPPASHSGAAPSSQICARFSPSCPA
jgi:hypothetical protein